MIAALPMYDWPETAGANDILWSLIRDALRRRGIDAPGRLARGRDPWSVWQDPDLLLAQTCGMPFRTRLHGQVTLVGTPDYDLPDARPGHYYSQIIARHDDPGGFEAFRDRTLAYNEDLSQSGWAAPRCHANALGFDFSRCLQTGAHRASAEAVAEGRADLAAIDAVTWRLIEAHRPALAESLRIVARTDPTPGLPLITAQGRDPAPLAAAVEAAIAALPDSARETLGLRGFVRMPAEAYLAVPNPPAIMAARA